MASKVAVGGLGLIRVVGGNLVKVMSWYDDEWDSPARWSRSRCSSSASMPPPGSYLYSAGRLITGG